MPLNDTAETEQPVTVVSGAAVRRVVVSPGSDAGCPVDREPYQPGRRMLAAVGGITATVAALGIIWAARSTVGRPVYVSELGADGEPTAAWFRLALLLITAACFLIAAADRTPRRRSALRILAIWPIAGSIATAGALFFIASQVPCTTGCPLPSGGNAAQDFTHTAAAVLAFTFGIIAMIQTATAPTGATLRWLSAGCGIAVLLIAATGGLLSLARVATDLGGILEFTATTIGLGWFAIFGISITIDERSMNNRRPAAGRSPDAFEDSAERVDL